MKQRYLKYEELGRGGMGVVYRAMDRLENNKWIALKQLHSDLKRGDIDTTQVDNRRVAMSHEFRLLASLRHPNIISVLDYGFIGEFGEPYFTMDLLNEPQSIVEATENCTFEQRITYLLQCLDGIAYLHQHKIVHRDLKPDNVMVDKKQVKILDFGLSHGGVFQSQATLNKDFIAGTLAYMAPEILMEKPPTHLADLYALGCIAYEIFTRQHPLGMPENIALLITATLTKRPDMTTLPPELVPIIERLLAKDPDDRYQNAQDVIHAISNTYDFIKPDESLQIRENILQSAPFVGRDDEFNRLKEALRQVLNVHNAKGSAWLIGGESGIGKSRLLNELRIQAMIRGVVVSGGQGIQEGGAVYELWRQPFRHLCLEHQPKLEEASILKTIIPDIEMLLGQTIPDAPPALNPKIALERLLTAIESWLECSEQPTLLVLEDIHWSVESLVILKRIIPMIHKIPLLIVASFRDDERPDLPTELQGMEVMSLSRLSRDAIHDLSNFLLGDSKQETEIVNLLERETEGNALFIIEVFRALAESAGRINQVGKATIPPFIVSGGVQEIIRRRLASIKGKARELLQVAALAGRQLDTALLKHLLDNTNLDYLLLECTESLILEVHNNQYRFVHDKFREALRDQIPDDESRLWHEHIAKGLEALYPDDESRAPILLHHWILAENQAKIIHYADLSGNQSMLSGANLQAQQYYYQAYGLLNDLEDNPDNQRRQIELAIKLSRVAAYHPDESLTQIMKQAVITAEAIGDEELLARALGSTGAYHFMLGQTGASMQYFQRSMVLAEKMNIEELLLLPYNIIGRSVALVGDFAASRNNLRKGIELAEKFRDSELLSGSLAFYALSLMMQGVYTDAIPIIERSIKVAEQVGASRMTGTLVINGCGYMWNGRWDDALDFHTRSEELASKINDFLPLYWSRGFLGYIYMRLGDLEKSRHVLDQSLSMIEEGKTVFHLPLFKVYRAELTLHEGDLEQALELADQALQFGRDTQQGLAVGEGLNTVGKIYSKLGEIDKAESYFEQAIENHIAGGRLVQEAVTQYDIALHRAFHNNQTGATEALEIAIPKFVSYQMQWYLQKAHQLHASLMP
ncbi:MAG: protein kinase [Aggregatilineales bacterium]